MPGTVRKLLVAIARLAQGRTAHRGGEQTPVSPLPRPDHQVSCPPSDEGVPRGRTRGGSEF